jgi:acyl-CoA synthetase (AMP-forming)/AMP-acid ligase II
LPNGSGRISDCSTRWRASAASTSVVAEAESVLYDGPRLAAPIPPISLPQLVRERARRHPDAVALVEASSGRALSYAELDQRIGRIAAGLAALGLRPGDLLLMFAPNSPEWPLMALGAMAAGGAVTGANPQYAGTDLAHQLADSGARFVCATPAGVDTVREAASQHGVELTIVVLGEAATGTVGIAQLLGCTDPEPIGPPDLDALAALPYSSGTTGAAKGVRLTHRTLVANVLQVDQMLPLPPGTVVLAFLPMFHIYGFAAITLCSLVGGAKVVTLPRFDPDAFLSAIETYRVTRVGVVPPVVQFLANHPMVEGRNLSSLDRVGSGAAPLGADVEDRVAARLGRPVTQGYGMTESSGVWATTPAGRGRRGSSGLLLPGTQARVIDIERGSDVPRGGSGELWLRGPQAFAGYHRQPEATAATITPDGWVRTGDIGHFDTDGYLFITDRLKELIKVKGFQVAPAELEALLFTHPDVADAAVIGRADERAGELPVAYVVPRAKALDTAALLDWVADRVVAYKRLADVVVCESIPKTAAGKILRRELRQRDARRCD